MAEARTSQLALPGCVFNDGDNAVAIISMPCNPLWPPQLLQWQPAAGASFSSLWRLPPITS